MLDNNDTAPEFNSVVTPSATSSELPQFTHAEYTNIPGTERCRFCNNLVTGEYYRIHQKLACATCAQQAQIGLPTDSHSAFARGLLLGIGVAIVGSAAYATFTIVTHIYLGYLGLGVGWLVGKAITRGSNGIGGRQYQIASVALTYFAISIAEIPITLAQIARDPSFHSSLLDVTIRFWPKLLSMGLISPFTALSNPFQGAIGLLILFIGLRIAWRLTAARPIPVDGPYQVAAS